MTVLVRADYNVPMNSDGTIGDDYRIKQSLPTLRYLLKNKCKVVIISHLGRPDGVDLTYSLEPAALRLSELLGEPVRFCDQTIGDKPRMAVKRTPKASIIVLENLRFFSEEEANDQSFAHSLAGVSGARYFVQDGFGVVHRAHASTSAITNELPSIAGLLLEKEYTLITDAMTAPKRPLVAVLGGAKVSDKIKVIKKLIDVADTILIGGAMANTFLHYNGKPVGGSKIETDQTEVLNEIYDHSNSKVASMNNKIDDFICLPTDAATAQDMSGTGGRMVKQIDDIEDHDMVFDIGDETIERYTRIISQAGTIIWNGPVGVSQIENFSHGSARIALASAMNHSAVSIIGGGDTADFVLKWEQGSDDFTHISTGGGASLELMAGDKLPGIEALLDAPGQLRYTNKQEN